jgi:FlaA1/EpsC-like NDP-sugar epimerase
MYKQIKNPKFYMMIFSDAVFFTMAFFLAYLLRFEFKITSFEQQQIQRILVWLVPFKLLMFFAYGLYRGIWRYTSIKDFWYLAQASLLSTLLIMAIILYRFRFQDFSRAVFLMDGVLTFLLTGGLRMFIRYYFQSQARTNFVQFSQKQKKHIKKVLIIGAGDAGEKILREISDNPQLTYQVVGFLDDNLQKQGRTVHGVPVFGPVEMLPVVVEKEDIQDVFVAIPSASGSQIRRIADTCKACEISYKILPGMGEIIDGRVSLKVLRDISYQDLLGREPVNLNIPEIESYLYDRTVMITGCGGSIGSELCRQLTHFHPRSLLLIDASEANLFQIQTELHHEIHYHNYHSILGSVQDPTLINRVLKKYRPQVVFHAAAYKHVPMLEKNPWEAVFNNIKGTRTVMESALEHGVERFVLVSTDKAVNPINVMGASKRVTELILQSLQGNQTRFMAVRFGNVIGSSGSVIPIFRRQIGRGGPVTVTHPEITRYFMSIPEAAQLIIQAGSLGKGGEIFVLEMGTPVKILDMAKDLIRLSGKEPDRDIPIIFTGLREGEKLYEELISSGEDIKPTVHKKIMVLQSNCLPGNWENLETFQQGLNAQLEALYECARRLDSSGIKRKLQEIIPEYIPQEADGIV